MIPFIQLHSLWTFLLGVFIVGLILWFYWPKKGGWAFLQKQKRNKQKELLEDSLKYLFDGEYKKKIVNIETLAHHLSISDVESERIVNKLQTMKLVEIHNQQIELTDEGRNYALRVIRIHRIWERYLADETDTAPIDWHDEACKMEHLLSQEDAENLASQMGNPVYDPHGDPIPTAKGKLPEKEYTTLNHLKEGDTAVIIHLEDEPIEIYEQLIALDLHPGMQIYVTDVEDKKITFVAHSEQCSLTPLFAKSIEVQILVDSVPEEQSQDLLSSLDLGEEAEIIGISPNCRGLQRRRLMDLGVVPGSRISAVIKSASGDPMGYRVMGTTIGLRRQQSDQILIKK